MRWPPDVMAVVDDSIAAARGGVPTVLAVEGGPGFGKSTLLSAVTASLDGFHVLRAYGEDGTQDETLQLLDLWEAIPDDAPRPGHAMQAWRRLADRVDRLQLTGPVALVVDDLHWIDPDSVAALAALARRADGDRLVVAVTCRPPLLRDPAWRRVADDPERTRVIRLGGLDVDAARDLVTSFAPDADDRLAGLLREHTAGNPLLMRALLREYDATELTALGDRGELPAPQELARLVETRLDALDPAAVALLRTLAVLGDGHHDLRLVAEIGGVTNPEEGVQVLRDADLAVVRAGSVTPQIRIAHAALRAAAYTVMPGDIRRGLRASAGARLPGAADRLRHRFAAATTTDDSLAADLALHADELHAAERFREAARLRRMAAAMATADEDRENLSLDADAESIAAHDLRDVEVVEPDASSSAYRRVVTAMRLAAEKHWARSARVLDAVGDDDIAELDERRRYRALVLRGWSIVAAGRDPLDAVRFLEEAAASTVPDPALRAQFTFAYGQALQAKTFGNDEIWGFESTLDIDRADLAASADGVVRLAWRGAIYSLSGSPAKAIADLSVVVDNIGDGSSAFSDGVFHALLGFAQWLDGRWRRATATISVARQDPLGTVHPLVAALAPLTATTNAEDLTEAMESSRRARIAAPLRSAVHAGDIADVLGLAYRGTPSARSAWFSRRAGDFGDPRTQPDSVVPYLWLLCMGISAAWAGDADAVDDWADRLEPLDGGEWRPVAIAWLRALASGVRGEPMADRLIAAAEDGLTGMPSVTAILWTHAADAAAAEAHPRLWDVRDNALSSLAALGAADCAPFMLARADSSGHVPGASDDAVIADPLAALSGREREVVALLLEGLSYAQIAKELYVTRSTVSFHLSNAYAKTSTTSRHELVQLVRSG